MTKAPPTTTGLSIGAQKGRTQRRAAPCSERERIGWSMRRSFQHQRLLALGCIREQNVNIREASH